MLNFFSSAFITLLTTTGYEVLYGNYLAAKQKNKLTQFPVCANVGVLFSLEIPPQSCEKRIKTDFLFSNLGNVMPCFGALSAS